MLVPEQSGLSKITGISVQAKNKNRVNVSVDGKYRFSLDIFQVGELGIKVGKEVSEKELLAIESEGQFSKLYMRALEYCMMRPRSTKEMRDYLWKKTLSKKYKTRTGDIKDRPGVAPALTERVLTRLIEKEYVNDESFARWWVEYRNQTKGASLRKLQAELAAKGISRDIAEKIFADSSRNDDDELQKVIAKKQKRYPDQQKFMAYLLRQGFSYDSVKRALDAESEYDG